MSKRPRPSMADFGTNTAAPPATPAPVPAATQSATPAATAKTSRTPFKMTDDQRLKIMNVAYTQAGERSLQGFLEIAVDEYFTRRGLKPIFSTDQ